MTWLYRAAADDAVERLRPEASGDATVHGRAVDVTDPEQVEALWSPAVEALGGVDQGGGQVFNILGGGDGSIRPGMGAYSATKRGLDSCTRSPAKEVTGTGVRIGQVRPGILITEGWLREAAVAPPRCSLQRSSRTCFSNL